MDKEEQSVIQRQYMDKFLDRLPMLRSAAKITQIQFAKKLGVSRSTVVVIETREREFKWNMYLSMVLVFIQHEDSRKLLESFELFDSEFLQNIK